MPDIGCSAKRVTIMMTDVEGSTALRRTVGDELTDEILELHGLKFGMPSYTAEAERMLRQTCD